MARKLEVDLILNSLLYTRGLEKAATQTKAFGTEMQHLGRHVLGASAAFVGFAGVTEFLSSSVSAAHDAAISQRQLAAQMKASGESFTQSKGRIDQAGLAMERFGFTTEDSAHALTVLERGTGNVTRAIHLQGLAADIARAKGISLAAGAAIVAKVFGGQESALRRAVPGLEKHAHGMDLIREAYAKVAGQAAAATTPSERFQSTLHNTEVIIGTALLPTLNKYLGELGKWLDKMNRTGRLQRDVNDVVKTASGLIQDATPFVQALAGAFKTLADAVGGTKNAIELLIGAFAGFKALKWAGEIGKIGAASSTTAGELGGLEGSLSALTAAPYVITLLVAYKDIKDPGSILSRAKGLLGVIKGGGFLERAAEGLPTVGPVVKALHQGLAAFGGTAAAGGLTGPLGRRTPAGPLGPLVPATGLRGPATGAIAAGFGPLTAQQNLAYALAANPNSIPLLQQQAQHDRAALAFAEKLRARGTITTAQFQQERLGYRTDLTSTLAQIASIRASRVKTAKAAGAQGYSEPLALQVELARAQAGGNQGGILTALKALRASVRRALQSGKLSLIAQKEAWDELTSLNDQIKNTAKGAKDDYRAQRARAVRLAHAQGADYQFAYNRGGPVVHIEHFHSSAGNPRALEDELVKRARARPHVRRGA